MTMRTMLPARRARSLLIALLLGSTTACSSLLDVEVPSRIEGETLEAARNAPLLVNSAISDFECAFVNYILAGGLLGDELQDAQLGSAMWPYDQRQFKAETDGLYATATCESGSIGVYTPLSTARYQADNALQKLDAWSDTEVADRTTLLATAAAYSGYSHLLLGEGMCSVALDMGPELTRAQVFERSVERFNRAIQLAQTANKPDILNMARVGKARSLLNLGRKTEAAAEARQVPKDFVKNATYSPVSPRRENKIYTRNIREGSVSVEDDFRNLAVEGKADPRVSVRFVGTSRSDNTTPLWVQAKYTSESSPIPIATGDEAQLIVAEADGGQTAVGIINAFRDRAGLARFASTDPQAIQQAIIQERARELFLESHHLGDKYRYNLPFTPVAGTPYPPKAGGFYGDMKCFPLPNVERLNNPSITR
jgi:starch-binding outer membrane protein, SusD/RagB family